MALTVEDGSGVAGADSYISRADFITYAATLGITITDDATADTYLVKAAEYIDSHEENMLGIRAARDQAMAFPRVNLLINGWYWASDEIPTPVINAQKQYALDVYNGKDLWNRGANPNLAAVREKIDVIETQYAVVDGQAQELSYTSKGDAWLSQILEARGMTLVRA